MSIERNSAEPAPAPDPAERALERHLLPRRGVLAVAVMVDVAQHKGHSPVAARALAARHGMPPRHLETLLQGLVRAGLLRGLRGPGGGYALGRESRRISVGEVVRAVVVDPAEEATSSRLLSEVVEPVVAAAARRMMFALDALSIEELRQEALKKGVFAKGTDGEGFAP